MLAGLHDGCVLHTCLILSVMVFFISPLSMDVVSLAHRDPMEYCAYNLSQYILVLRVHNLQARACMVYCSTRGKSSSEEDKYGKFV